MTLFQYIASCGFDNVILCHSLMKLCFHAGEAWVVTLELLVGLVETLLKWRHCHNCALEILFVLFPDQ